MKRKLNLKLLPFFCFSAFIVTACNGGGGASHVYEEHAAVAATCEGKGNKKYYTCSETACKGKYYNEEKKEVQWSEIEIAPLGHDYDLKYTWTESGEGMSCHGEGTCKREGCGKKISEDKEGTYVVDVEPTCIAKEEGHYHVEFDNKDLKTADSDKIEGELGDHELEKVEGKKETCMEDGYKDAYKCKHCNTYYSINDPKEENKIGDETAYSNWKKNGGKIDKHAHTTQKVTGSPETCTEDGWKDAYKCTECNNYFEESTATTLIGDETAYTAWKTAGGKIAKHAHSYGNLVAQVDPTRDADGKAAYYQCSECHGFFDKDKNPTTEEKLVIKSESLKVTIDNEFEVNTDKGYDLKPNISISEAIAIDFKFSTPTTKKAKVEIALGDGWSKYAGRFGIELDTTGAYKTVSPYAGISFGMTEDGYFRIYVNIPKVTIGDAHSSIEKINLLMVKVLSNDTYEKAIGDIRLVPSALITDVKMGEEVTASSYVDFYPDYKPTMNEKIAIDFKFESDNTQNLVIYFRDTSGGAGWDDNLTKAFTIKPDGTLVDQRCGAQVVKVADERGFTDGYYRLIIDLNCIEKFKQSGTFSTITVVELKNTGAHVSIDLYPACRKHNPWYTIEGKTDEDVQFQLETYNNVTIKDGQGELLNKKLHFEVKGINFVQDADAKVKFTLMDSAWKNCGLCILTFKNNVLTGALFQGTGDNAWGKITDIGGGAYGINIELSKLSGDGLKDASRIEFYYAGESGRGLIKNGVSSFSLNLDSFSLVD